MTSRAGTVPAAGGSQAAPLWPAARRTLPLAAVLWLVIFRWRPLNFWVLMTGATVLLGLLALRARGNFLREERLRPRDVVVGMGTGILLYAIFVVGDRVVRMILPFAGGEVGAIYGLRALAPPAVLALLLTFAVAPGEELYWRGLVQEALRRERGPVAAWLLTLALYGGVHFLAGGIMLGAAASTAGAVWGYLYVREGRVMPVLISHVFWDLAIFLIVPLH